jgi:hypothetical protein
MADSKPGDGPPSILYFFLTGAVALLSWFSNWTEEPETLRRDMYATREDCAQDWGDERNCEPDTTHRVGTGHGA